MSSALPTVVVTSDSHPAFVRCYQKHPEILTVFWNIAHGMDLGHSLEHLAQSAELVDIYIDRLFLPILVESDFIMADANTRLKYRAIVERVQLDPNFLRDRATLAQVASKNVQNLAGAIGATDSTENTILAYIEGCLPVEVSEEKFARLKGFLRDEFLQPDDSLKDGVPYYLGVLGWIPKGVKK